DRQQLDLSYLLDRYNKYDKYTRLDVDSLNYRNTQHTARTQYGYSFNPGNSLTVGMEFFRDELMSYQFDGQTHSINDYIMYAQHDFSFVEGLNLVYGVRMDCYSSFGLHLSPNLSLMYKLKPLTFRGSYARGFRAPSLKEMYTEWDMGNQGWFIIKGNPNLSPELSDNI
ncbi:TonB-dependent receptor HmuR, partial [gut metagenome]